jgi:hypothetical protein
MHYIQDFQDGDVINISDVLQEYDPLTDNINNFVRLNHIDTTRTDIRINADGIGGGFTSLTAVFVNWSGETVDSLIASGKLAADRPLFGSDT